MKNLLRMLAAATLLASCTANNGPADEPMYYCFTSFHEPADEGLRLLYSDDGLHWDSIPGTLLRPQIGQNIMRDPSIIRDREGVFHLVWTIAWKGDTGFGYARSTDLVNWSEQRRIPAMDHVYSTQNVWAPEWFYDDERDEYMIVYASCVVDAGFDVGIEDEKNNHRLYCVTTHDFETFSDPRLFYDPGFSCIDATFVKRGEGDYVMVIKDNTRPNRNIKVAFAEHAAGPYGPASEPFTESFCEGPSVAKVGDEYYIYYDAYQNFAYEAVRTADFRTFADASDKISVPKGHKHGTVFMAPRRVVDNLGKLRRAPQDKPQDKE